MKATERPETETWYVLKNGTVLMESSDPESGMTFFFQLQSARQIVPDDLRAHDEQTMECLTRFESRWSWALGIGPKLLVVLLVAVGVGLLLAQFGATKMVGGWMFWLGIPIAVLLYVTLKAVSWRLETMIRKIQTDAGLVPGMIDEIEHAPGLDLIEAHLIDFKMKRNTLES